MKFNRINKPQTSRQPSARREAAYTNVAQISAGGMGNQAALDQAIVMLNELFKSYGLRFPKLDMADPHLKHKVVAIGKTTELAKTNVKALNQLAKHTAVLMAGQVKLAEFYATATQIAVAGKQRIDKATADAFLTLAGYNEHSQTLSGNVQRKLTALEARHKTTEALAEGKLKTGLELLRHQKELGEKRQEETLELQTKRQDLLHSVGIKRQEEAEYIRYGHLK